MFNYQWRLLPPSSTTASVDVCIAPSILSSNVQRKFLTVQRLYADLLAPGKRQYAEVLHYDRPTKLYFDFDQYADDEGLSEQDVKDMARSNLLDWLSSVLPGFITSECIWLVRSGDVDKKGKT